MDPQLLHLRSMKNIIALTFIAFSSLNLFAHEDLLGQLVGDKLGLFYKDHTVSGHVNGQIIYATPVESGFGMRLVQRISGKDYVSEFKKTETGLQGELIQINDKGTQRAIQFEMTTVSAKEGFMQGRIGDKPFTAQIRAKAMEGHHFVKPEFLIELPNKTYQFHLENGMACMGCATKLVYVVLGMLEATGAL